MSKLYGYRRYEVISRIVGREYCGFLRCKRCGVEVCAAEPPIDLLDLMNSATDHICQEPQEKRDA